MQALLGIIRGYSLVLAATLVLVNFAAAEQYTITGQGAMTLGLPGGFAGLVNPNTGAFYTADPYGLGPSFAFEVVLDTGASGCLLSQTIAGSEMLNIPTTGETYSDVGIGGVEEFYVSQPTRLMLAPMSFSVYDVDNEIDNTENPAYYSARGEYKFQIRQEDPVMFGMYPVAINIVGTPVLNQYVMHVKPNSVPYSTLIPTIDYMETELLTAMPNDLPGGVFRVPLHYQDFVNDPNVPVSTGKNPVIPGVRVVDDRRGPNDQSAPSDWLFDTGGSLSIIGRNMATAIGIDLENEDPVITQSVMGVGGDQRLLFGYQVDKLVIPLAGGNELVFQDVVLFVPEEGALPADLPGIFGMNMIGSSFSELDPVFGFPLDFQESPFSDWYVNPGDGTWGELVLVIPEPGSWVLLWFAVAAFAIRRLFP